MVSITFFGLFLFVLFIGSVILFYVEQEDLIYKLLFMAGAVVFFIFLVIYSFYMIGQDFGLDFDKDLIVLDKMDIQNLVWVDEEIYTATDISFVFEFKEIMLDQENIYEESNFCFYYNNSDNSPNVVAMVNGVTVISDFVYLNNNTFGSVCTHFNSSFIKKNALLGLTCLDCSVPNPLNIPEAQIEMEINEIHITKANPLTYVIERQNQAHAFWIEAKRNSGELVRQLYFLFFLALFGFILAFGYRAGYKWMLSDLPNEIPKE